MVIDYFLQRSFFSPVALYGISSIIKQPTAGASSHMISALASLHHSDPGPEPHN